MTTPGSTRSCSKPFVEHLLTHTSGIPTYTNMAEWLPRRTVDLTLDDLIALFKDKPLEFAPGERWAYNNSGYILLGAMIEKLAGTSYAEFLHERIFAPLGMSRTAYDDTGRIIVGRASGYDHDGETWRHAPYLSMTHPHAAGALLSTIDDLARWDAALSAGELVSRALLERAWRPYRLTSGETVRMLHALGGAEFFSDEAFRHVRFLRDETGAVTGLETSNRFSVERASRTGGPTPDAP
jgi:D-alanyl-D-alanine carboxypeptidase